MRIGALLVADDDRPERETAAVDDAVASGAFAVLLDDRDATRSGGDRGLGIVRTARLAATTLDARIVVRVVLGAEHPVTLAEEVAVLDHLSGGRVVVLVDPADLDVAGAAEDLRLLLACWSGRPVRHRGTRWSVPSGVTLPDLGAAGSLAVTPVPAQVELPVWLSAPVADSPLPVLATAPAGCDPQRQVQPGVATLSGELAADRALVREWSAAGATHLLLRPPSPAPADFFRHYVARYLQPEVAMPDFPRIMADAAPPVRWTPSGSS